MSEPLRAEEVAEIAKSRYRPFFINENGLRQVREWLLLLAAVNRIEDETDDRST